MSLSNLAFELIEELYSVARALRWTAWMFRALAITFLTSFLFSACTSVGSAPPHGVLTKNVGKGNLSDVVIEYAKPIIFKGLTPQTPKSERGSFGHDEIPKIMSIKWESADGSQHAAQVVLKDKLNYANGGLWAIEIRFADDLVEVYEITASGSRREINHFRRIYPE